MAPVALQPLGSLSRLFLLVLFAVALFVIFRPAPPDVLPQLPRAMPPAEPDRPVVLAPPGPGDPNDNAPPPPPPIERSRRPLPPEPTPQASPQPPAEPDAEHKLHYETTTIDNITVRGREGDVAYRGQIDVAKTLSRIEAGQSLPFADDGITFENREHRLPARPRGYYHEFVHPTPHLPSPGPQRIVVGERGEVYYTPDHYRTFRKL